MVASMASCSGPLVVSPENSVRRDKALFVVGSRYVHGVSVVNWPLHRIALSAAANRYVRVHHGSPGHGLHERVSLLATGRA